MNNPHQAALVKLIAECSYQFSQYDVFRDFVEMAAIAISNPIDRIQAPAREQRYLQIIGKYRPQEQKLFPKMLGELIAAMECGPSDVLGATFGELELGNANVGQFFTPFELCRLMARVTVGDGEELRAHIRKRGFVTAQEPACGAGAQILALAEAMQQVKINYQQHLHVTAVDIDARAVHMTYLQLSLAHVPAVVTIGNTLTLEMREHWYTPAHILGFWDAKLRRGYALGSEMDGATEPQFEAPPAPITLSPAPKVGQLDMFANEDAA
jgi:hypothetical protein